MMTAEEKLMYQVMKAIYDSGIPIDFKGSMVLKACLLEAGYTEEIRHTVDIDANWYSEQAPTAGQMIASLQKALTENGIDLDISLYRMYGEGRVTALWFCDCRNIFSTVTGHFFFNDFFMHADLLVPVAHSRQVY